MRKVFLDRKTISKEEEIYFFKKVKPAILSYMFYFNDVYSIEINYPSGSKTTIKEYYLSILNNLNFFFKKHLDFYNYYRTKQTHLDEKYFLRGKLDIKLCIDDFQFMHDPLFSTGYDYLIAKIISNDLFQIYINKKLQSLETMIDIPNNGNSSEYRLKWTGKKTAAIELGYALYSDGVFNNGTADIREIMTLLGQCFNINLNNYYRTYTSLKNRKKDRTAFLKHLIDSLEKRMDEDDFK